FIYHSYK
uniref:Hypothalamic heptapeptide n=1 Tax=Sus scrofa TaxID=9823 RepID=HY7_PIG|nr:RecName: Full=Hypothalamic heptapeptide [Sus scrofa]